MYELDEEGQWRETFPSGQACNERSSASHLGRCIKHVTMWYEYQQKFMYFTMFDCFLE